MSEYTKPEKSIWKLADGKDLGGPQSELPKSNASLIAKAGHEYPTEWLKEQGWGKKAPAKKLLLKKQQQKNLLKPKLLKNQKISNKES